MSEEIQKLVASLPGMSDVNNVRDLVEQRVEHGDAAFAADLGIALFNVYGAANSPIWQYRSVVDAILRLLVITAGAEDLGPALRLIGASSAGDRKRVVRGVAARLESVGTGSRRRLRRRIIRARGLGGAASVSRS